MPQIGPLEILIVGFLALLVFGPDKLPEMARSVGKGLKQLKSMASDAKSEFDMNLKEESEAEPPSASVEVPNPVEQETVKADAQQTVVDEQRTSERV